MEQKLLVLAVIVIKFQFSFDFNKILSGIFQQHSKANITKFEAQNNLKHQ